MKIINSVASWVLKKRMHQMELFMRYPLEVQNDWFQKLISSAKNTEFGEKHNFKHVKTVSDFKNQVPIQTYETLKEYIFKIKAGHQNVLWPSEIKWFAKSSGTTADKSKFIPVSKESLEDCHYKGGKDMLSIYLNNFPDSELFTGKALVIGGSSQINHQNNNSYYGDLSSIILKNLPYWAEYTRIPSLEIALMPEWEEKIERMAQIAAKENVTNITGVPTWNLVMIKRVLEITGKSNMLEVWPNFELYMHGGVSFKPYRETFKKLFPSEKVTYLETYNASEGFFGIQDRFDVGFDDMLLMLDYGIFYEFMPIEQFGSENPITIGLEDVEIGKNYALIISTNAGLWRYLIGDTVVFTSTDPFRIQVSGRTKYYINAFGEELIADNADRAIEIACQKTNSLVKEYTAAPIFLDLEGKGAHQWLIEFEKEPTDLEFFVNSLDNALKMLNSDYEAKRYKNLALEMPKVQIMPANTFYNWLKQRGRLGGQNKVPRLSNTRTYVDSILTSLKS